MTIRQAIKHWEPKPLQIIVILAMMQLVIALLTDGFALTFDEALWQFIGRNWFRHGLVPYAGGVDNQSPLIFAIFGLSDKLFGVNYWFPRVIATICQSIGLFYVYKIALHLEGKKAGLLAISFYGLALLWRVTGNKYVAYTETYDVMFVILSFYAFLTGQNKKDILISGCFAGLGIAFRLTAGFAIVAIFISLLRKKRVNAIIFCLGGLISMCVLLLAALLAGINLHDLLANTITDNLNSGSPYDHTFLWKLEQFSDKFLYSEMVLFYPMVMAYLYIKKNIDVFALWLIFGFVGVSFIGEYTWVHLRELLPALSIMSASAINYLTSVYKVPFKPAIFILWVVFFPKLLEPLVAFKKLITGKTNNTTEFCKEPYVWPDDATRKKIGWWIKSNTTEQEKVYVAGYGSQIQVYSERPSVYFNEMQTKLAKDRLYADIQLNKPGMILVPLFPEYKQYMGRDIRMFIDSMVAKDYDFDRCIYNYNVFKIKEGAATIKK